MVPLDHLTDAWADSVWSMPLEEQEDEEGSAWGLAKDPYPDSLEGLAMRALRQGDNQRPAGATPT